MAVVRSPAILGKDAVSSEAIKALPEESILTLFGQTRTSLITLAIETSKDGMKEYTRLRDVAEKARRSGTGVPGSFCPELVFYHFQQDHGAILRRTPLPVAKVETWLYGFGRWAVRAAHDDTRTSDFNFIRDTATKTLADLDEAQRHIAASPGYTIRAAIKRAAVDLINKFSLFRTMHVRKLVENGLTVPQIAYMHDDFRTILAAYEQLHASMRSYVETLIAQIDNEGLALPDVVEQEVFIGNTFIGFFRAFIRGLLGVSHIPSPAVGTRPVAPLTPRLPPVPATTFNFGASPAPSVSEARSLPASTPSTVGFMAAGGGYATMQNAHDQHPASGPFSLEQIARQIAHGYRQFGPYIGPGGPSGSAEGIDLKPEFRRALAAYQVLGNQRQYGQLLSQPPADLPPLLPYESIFHPTSSPYNGGPPGGTQSSQIPPASGGGTSQSYNSRSDTNRGKTQPGSNLPQSDELYIPFSYGMLGAFSPYRNMRAPDSCYECGLRNSHSGYECPQRFGRVRGEAPPGWRLSGRTADKDPAQWKGPDLTDEARAAYRAFITTHHLSAHRSFPISVDDIVGDNPPLARKAGGRP